jgi:hypothetical protein
MRVARTPPGWRSGDKESRNRRGRECRFARACPQVLQSPARQDEQISILSEGDEEPTSDDPAVNDEPRADAEDEPADESGDGLSETAIDAIQSTDRSAPSGVSDTLKASKFEVAPGASNAPQDALIEREQIPQKWLRIPIDLGTLRIDLSQPGEAIDRALAEFNTEMLQRMQTAIDAWETDDNPDTGGLLWGFPAGRGTQSRTITAADVVAWD